MLPFPAVHKLWHYAVHHIFTLVGAADAARLDAAQIRQALRVLVLAEAAALREESISSACRKYPVVFIPRHTVKELRFVIGLATLQGLSKNNRYTQSRKFQKLRK